MAHYKGAATEATRAMHIMKRRERAREELELKKKKIEEDFKLNTIENRFATHHDAIEAQLRSSTVGLVTLDQMRQKQVNAVKEREKQLAHKEEEEKSGRISQNNKGTSGDDRLKKSKTLSFGYDDDDDDDDDDDGNGDDDHDRDSAVATEKIEASQTSLSNVNKEDLHHDANKGHNSQDCPTPKKKSRPSIGDLVVDTSFLPDRERDEEERILREKLAAEWRERQQKLKEEEIEITFSYWDGSGHRRVVKMKKGNSIYQFLNACLDTLRKDFNELRNVSADQLMYVKEDLIIPHHYTFYDFIVTKARGKSGPLFAFDVHEDVRLIADATVEKDESHAGKVLLRSWYERNKHIFPASRWEPYDPTKTYEKYTISDKRAK